MRRILITGANGFIGQSLCAAAALRGFQVKGAVREACELPDEIVPVIVGEIDGKTNWAEALRDIDVVIHLAARVHVMQDTATEPLAEFVKVNLHGTETLAYQAARAGVKRLVYVSSIKVNGEQTTDQRPFVESDNPNPQDDYANSKWQAEQSLRRIAQETGLETVIVRPPLVYGPEVKGNFLSLISAIYKRIPLPLAGIKSARSLIYLGNLVDALLTCAAHPLAAGKTYLVCDDEDISIPMLIQELAIVLDKPARVFGLPKMVLRGLGALIGRLGSIDRLVESLRVNDGLIRKELGWRPKFTLHQGLTITSRWYKQRYETPSTPYLGKYLGDKDSDLSVSVVIVNYNAGEMLLESVARAHQHAEQVIVVDNASTDNSIAELRAEFRKTLIIRNAKNLGFATACNLGAKAAAGNYLLFLNPDCILESATISKLVEALRSAGEVGMVGGLLTNPDGSEQGGGRRAVPTPWRSFVKAFGLNLLGRRYPKLFADFALHKQPLPDQPIEVEAISGACMLVRRDVLEDVGLLDEGYFMHCEDLDWCMRFRRKGWKILFVPDARMIHYKGYCSKTRPIFVEWNKHKGMMRFYNKFFRHQYPGLLMGLVAVAVWLRFVAIAIYYLQDRLLRSLRLHRQEK